MNTTGASAYGMMSIGSKYTRSSNIPNSQWGGVGDGAKNWSNYKTNAERRPSTVGDKQFSTSDAALAGALERHAIDPTTVEITKMYGKNKNLVGPNGQPWEMVRGFNQNGEIIEFQHHASGHFFEDKNQFELPHYHGPDGEHLTYPTEYDRKNEK